MFLEFLEEFLEESSEKIEDLNIWYRIFLAPIIGFLYVVMYLANILLFGLFLSSPFIVYKFICLYLF